MSGAPRPGLWSDAELRDELRRVAQAEAMLASSPVSRAVSHPWSLGRSASAVS